MSHLGMDEGGEVPDAVAVAEPSRAAFTEALAFAAGVMEDPAVERSWPEPSALVGYSVGALASHLYAAVRRLEVALDAELPAAPIVVGLAGFYGANRIDDPGEREAGVHALIRSDAERRAELGHQVVLERFRALAGRLEARLASEPLDRPVPVVQVEDGVTPLRTYLDTRTCELVVHGDDLACSIGVPTPQVPELAGIVTVGVLVELARERVGALGVIRAMARSERADPGALRAL